MVIQPWVCDKVEVKPALNGEKGMYATGSFKAGEKIGVFGGIAFTDEQLAEFQKADRVAELNLDQAMYIHPGILLLHPQGEPYYPLCYSNHSCDANAKVQNGVVMVAARDIQPGEEICWDYRITDDVGIWEYEFKCGCGKPNCCGTLQIGPKHRNTKKKSATKAKK